MLRHRGFTLIEILIVLVIGLLVTQIVWTAFSSFRSAQALNNDTDQLVSLLSRARSETLSAFGGNQYGVHLASSTLTLFTGGTYHSADTTNQVVTLGSTVTLSSWSLQGGGSDIVFNRLTGKTSQYGSIIIGLTTASTSRTVSVSQTGLVSLN